MDLSPTSSIPPPIRIRTRAQKWRTRAILSGLFVVGAGLYHQFLYSRKVRVWHDAMFLLEEDLVPEVTAETGVLSRFPWWDVRGATWSWEWR